MLVILCLAHLPPDSSSALVLLHALQCDPYALHHPGSIALAFCWVCPMGGSGWRAQSRRRERRWSIYCLAPCLLPFYSPPRLCLLSDSPSSPPRPCPGSGKGILSPGPTVCLCFLTVAEPWVLHQFLHGSQDFVHISCK